MPLLATADFEYGAGMRIAGATRFPRAMAIGAAGDEQLAFEAGRITAVEGRAMGVHVNFAPVADVNNNPRNPVINTRSFGEDPARVGALRRRLRPRPAAGRDAGDAQALPRARRHRHRLAPRACRSSPIRASASTRWSSPPFRAGHRRRGRRGDGGAHRAAGARPGEGARHLQPGRSITDLLRRELAFDGLIVTDAMKMDAIVKMMPPGEAAVRAVRAGADMVLDSPDPVRGVHGAQGGGDQRTDRSRAGRRVGRARAARQGAARPAPRAQRVGRGVRKWSGGRAHQAVARAISEQSVTLVKDDGDRVPFRLPPTASVLYLSVLDYPAGWRIAAPSRTIIPELKKRWPADRRRRGVGSDRRRTSSTWSARWRRRYDAVVAGVFVRVTSGSGRIDLAPHVRASGAGPGARDQPPRPADGGGVLRQARTWPRACRRCRQCC